MSNDNQASAPSVQVEPTGRAHELKTDPEVFDAVSSGAKTHEIRFNDRDFRVGDRLVLLRTESTGEAMRAGAPLVYTGQRIERVVSHVLSGYGLAEGWVILSFAQSPAQPAAPQPAVALLRELVSALDEKRSASEDPVQTVETAERSFAATARIWALLEPARALAAQPAAEPEGREP